jgi:hypothetical protein
VRALAGLLLLFVAPAHAGSLWGGDLFTTPTVHTEAGFSHTEGGVRVPLSPTVELMPRARLSFSEGFALDLRTTFALDLRLQVGSLGGFHAAVLLSVPITLDPDGRFVGVGVGLGHPGLVMDYTFPSEIAFVLGVRLEDDLYVRQRVVSFEGFLPFLFALEGQLGPRVRMGGKLEGGPAFGTGAGVRMAVRALLAVDVAL